MPRRASFELSTRSVYAARGNIFLPIAELALLSGVSGRNGYQVGRFHPTQATVRPCLGRPYLAGFVVPDDSESLSALKNLCLLSSVYSPFFFVSGLGASNVMVEAPQRGSPGRQDSQDPGWQRS